MNIHDCPEGKILKCRFRVDPDQTPLITLVALTLFICIFLPRMIKLIIRLKFEKKAPVKANIKKTNQLASKDQPPAMNRAESHFETPRKKVQLYSTEKNEAKATMAQKSSSYNKVAPKNTVKDPNNISDDSIDSERKQNGRDDPGSQEMLLRQKTGDIWN